MKNKIRKLLIPLKLVIIGALMYMAFIMIGAALRPNLDTPKPIYSKEEIEKFKKLRDPQLNPNDPPVQWQDVNYDTKESAPWWPPKQSPLLDALTENGTLPPVQERVGEEPLVMEGVEGNGHYGGTLLTNTGRASFPGNIEHMHSCSTLIRWSPHGYPFVPHVARKFEVNEDNSEFTFYLRKGLRWSDGEPYTADDIMYWYENEVLNEEIGTRLVFLSQILKHVGGQGVVEKIDDYTVRFKFNEPNSQFLPLLAGHHGRFITSTPAHYLKQYHPVLGDPEKIKEAQERYSMPSALSAYAQVKASSNFQHPRLWPWIGRKEQVTPPYEFVRNPYYFAIDTEGRQLPYFDRMAFMQKNKDLIPLSVANGEFSYQYEISFQNYTFIMSERENGGYEVKHWYPAERSMLVFMPNANRAVGPDKPGSAGKAKLLADKRFRKALSLAINRDEIIQTALSGVGEPEQIAPGKNSPYYYPKLNTSYVEFDPDRANAIFDELGLNKRDLDGMRTLPDGTNLVFYIVSIDFFDPKTIEMVISQWADVGIRAILQLRSRQMRNVLIASHNYDITVYVSGEEEYLTNPNLFVSGDATAPGYDAWFWRGGFYGKVDNLPGNAIEPPEGSPRREAIELYKKFVTSGSQKEREKYADQILEIAAENVWTINIATAPPALTAVKNELHNVPDVAIKAFSFLPPGIAGLETWWTDSPADSEGAINQLQEQLAKPYGGLLDDRKPVSSAVQNVDSTPVQSEGGKWGQLLLNAFTVVFWLALIIGLIVIAGRYPYIARRLLIMIPTMVIISIISFTIIQLPPGDYITYRIEELKLEGSNVSQSEVDEFRAMFYLDKPMHERYLRWLGVPWFFSFDSVDKGLLQGYLGRSMTTQQPVNEIVGDRIFLTFCISLFTILFTWTLAIPIGIYSAVKQYSIGDYILTFIGFLGMCVPNFLLAIILMFIAKRFFDTDVSGLFSAEYATQPEWDIPKFIDLMKHIWVPVVLLGVGGTAGMIRVMRANLLDELKKPYVTTARAKGVGPIRLLLKYPVRIALNPFISNIGHIFPMLISGGAITAIILSLPTVGPLMLDAFRQEDTYMAGSMLMILSLLGLFGTLVSDLLLLALDPRIRMEGRKK